ncbi:E3 ubiquitin-protein ligase Midline-1-like isoform X2 [Branchiostoma floridae x Branchiostoma japonicum]
MEGLEEELSCPVCLELFTCPLQLPCHHNLCRRCAEVLLQSETDSSQVDEEAAACSGAHAAPEATPDRFPCPTCRKDVTLDTRGLDGLMKNFLLQNIVERYMKLKGTTGSQQIPCQLCKSAPSKMAAQSCLTCKASYCEQCLTLTHPAFPPFTEHKLAPQTVLCPDHPTKPVEMYCVQDQTPVCLLCEKVGRHKQHNMAALEEVFSQRRAELQGRVDRLAARVAEEEEKVNGLENKREQIKTSSKELKTQIDEQCDGLMEVIRHRSAEMHQKVQRTTDQDEANLHEVIKRATDGMQKARTALSYAQEAMKETDHASLLLTDQTVKAKIEATIKTLDTNCEQVMCEIDKINIDLKQWKEDLENIDITSPPVAPVIKADQSSSAMEEARIVWDLVEEADVYDIRYTVGNVQIVSTVRGFSYTARGLAPGTKYKFEVSSMTKAGRSRASTIELVTTPFKFQLDPNTASKYLLLSQDNTYIRRVESPLSLPDVSLRFKGGDGQTVLGDTPIKQGRHYWEVSVKGFYSLGVAYGDMPRDKDIRSTTKSWAFNLYFTSELFYTFCLIFHERDLFSVNTDPLLSRIGILVDYEQGQLSFFNAANRALIYTHTEEGGFDKPLYPAFSLWMNSSLEIHSGLVCP